MNSDNITRERIYDRILERCYPIEVEGESRRTESFRANMTGIGSRLGL